MKPILIPILFCVGLGGSPAIAQSADPQGRNAANGVGVDAGENSSSQSRSSETGERDAGQNSTSSTRAPARSSSTVKLPGAADVATPARGRDTERDGSASTGAARRVDPTDSSRLVVPDAAARARRASDGSGQ